MYDLRVSVHAVKGNCNMPMKKGDYFLLKGGQLFIPDGECFCIYALQSVLPLLPAKQRNIVEEDDWLPDVKYVSCPDPAGGVILKIERCQPEESPESSDAAGQ